LLPQKTQEPQKNYGVAEMDESENKEVKAKRKSKLAVVSFWAGIAALIILGQFVFTNIILGIALIFGVVTFIRIKKNGGRLTDQKYVMLVIAFAILSSVFSDLSSYAIWRSVSLDLSDFREPSPLILYLVQIYTCLCMTAFVIALGTALICGAAALIQILMSGGKLGGVKYAIFGVTVCVLFIVFIVFPAVTKIMAWQRSMMCSSNLAGLGKAMLVYSQDNDDKYPTADKWCDLLMEYCDVPKKMFVCPDGKKAKCHYALNPNAEPNSPSDTVLLFETAGGELNQVGGLELISADNHNGDGVNVGFVDTHVEFWRTDGLEKLKWGAKRQ
jgi:prepilin-type processing-associated H-X9-DG protein